MSAPRPYTYADGTIYGETPADVLPATTYRPPRRRGQEMRLRRRRAENDPSWAGRTETSKRALLDIDAADEREAARRREGR